MNIDIREVPNTKILPTLTSGVKRNGFANRIAVFHKTGTILVNRTHKDEAHIRQPESQEAYLPDVILPEDFRMIHDVLVPVVDAGNYAEVTDILKDFSAGEGFEEYFDCFEYDPVLEPELAKIIDKNRNHKDILITELKVWESENVPLIWIDQWLESGGAIK